MEAEQQDAGDSGGDLRPTSQILHQGHDAPGHAQGSQAAAKTHATVVANPADLQPHQQQQQQHLQQQHQSQAGQAAPSPVVAPLTSQHLQQLQQQQQLSSWAVGWQDQPLNSSSGSGSSLGGLLGQVSATFPAAVGQLLASDAAATGAWQGERHLGGGTAPSHLDAQGRTCRPVSLQQLPRQLSIPTSGMLPSGVQYQSMSLPASPTMLHHQQQHQQLHPQIRHQHSISPSTGIWPDIEMEQPLAAAAAAGGHGGGSNNGENGENGESLLWPGGGLIPPSSSPNLLQPGVPLGLRLRSTAVSSDQQQYSQQQQRPEPTAAEQTDTGQSASRHGLVGPAAATAGMQRLELPWSSGRATPEQLLHDQRLMPPPPQVGGGLIAIRSGPRPPPLIIPSTQPQQQQQLLQQLQQLQQVLPTPSPALPTSDTSVTPALFSMALTDTPGGSTSIATALPIGHADVDSSGGGGRARRPRRRTSVPSSPAVPYPGAAAVPSGVAGLLAAGRRYIQVMCGSSSGWLDMVDMLIHIQGPEQEESRVTPSAFEALAGKGSTRKWRQSLIVMPLGQDDQLVPEPIALGDFMKQYQLDRPSSAAGQLGRISGSSAAAGEESVMSPGQYPSLVSPGVRRRRQSYPASQESAEPAAADPVESGDLPPEHVKRSRGAAGWTAQQQQQQLTWQQLPTSGMAARAGYNISQSQQQQEQVVMNLARSDIWHGIAAAAPGDGGGRTAADVIPGAQVQQQQHSLQRVYSAEDVHIAAVARLQQQQHEGTVQTHLQQHAQPLQQAWRPYSPQPLGYTAEQPAAVPPAAGAAREHPAVLQQQQRRRRQQASALSDQAELSGALQQQQLQQQPPAADVPSKTSEAAGQLLSPSGRPIRQPVSRRASIAAASSASAARYERGSQPVGFKGGIRHLQVWCDQLPGILDLYKMQVVPQEGQCEGQPMSLSAFEQLGGRGTARKWRRSLTAMDGNELISLGEWLERHQILATTEKHISPRVAPKPRGMTPPATAASASGDAGAGRSSRPGTYAPTYGWQSRDQQGGKPAQQLQHALLQGSAMGLLHVGGLHLQGRERQLQTGVIAVPNRTAPRPSLGQMSGQYVAPPQAGQGGGPPGSYQQQPQVHAAAAGRAAAEEPINQELLMMLTEYANEYVNLELGLHPAQVEQDLADVTAPTAGSAGVVSPRAMEWQQRFEQQQQQQQYYGRSQQPSAGLHSAAARADPAPPALFGMLPGAVGASMFGQQQQQQQQLEASMAQQQQHPLHATAQVQVGLSQQVASTPVMFPLQQYVTDRQTVLDAAATISDAGAATPAAAVPAGTYDGGFIPQHRPSTSTPTDLGQGSPHSPS